MTKVKVCDILNKTKKWGEVILLINDALEVAEKTKNSGLYLLALRVNQLLLDMASEEVEL